MELTPGYKQTEVGVVPEDWRVLALAEVAYIKTGNRNNEDKVEDGQYPFFVRSDVVERINSYSHDCEAILVPGEGRIGSIFHYVNGRFAVHQRVYAITRFRSDTDARYLYFYISKHFGIWAMQNTVKATVDSLRLPTFQTFQLALPPLPEQRAIAKVLTDVDALLEVLTRLIAKKRDLKQAAMQHLLTSQTRLPGFRGEWEVKRLREVGEIWSGGTPSTSQPKFWDGDLPWCTPTDITALRGRKYLSATTRSISIAGVESSSAQIIPARSLIMTSRATIGECAINVVPMTTNQGFKNVVPFADFDVEFLYYVMTMRKAGLIALCGGSTFLEIGKKQLAEYEILLPKDRSEQTAIATVLSDMDAEIQTLEARRDKTRALKQAMMQELLTGRTRLVEPEPAHA